jgi:hypothetical protein
LDTELGNLWEVPTKEQRYSNKAKLYDSRDKIPKDVLDDGKAVRAIDRKQDLIVQNYT